MASQSDDDSTSQALEAATMRIIELETLLLNSGLATPIETDKILLRSALQTIERFELLYRTRSAKKVRSEPATRRRQRLIQETLGTGQFFDKIAFQIAEILFENKTKIPSHLNSEYLDSDRGKGLLLCHGQDDIMEDFIFIPNDIEWSTADIDRKIKPTYILNIYKLDGYKNLGVFEWIIAHYCTGGGDLPVFFDAIYNVRYIMTQGSTFVTVNDIFTRYMFAKGVPYESYVIIRDNLIKQILEFCDYSSYDVLDQNGDLAEIDEEFYSNHGANIGSRKYYGLFRV